MIDLRHGRFVERQQFASCSPSVAPHLDQIAGAEIMDRDDGAELLAGAVDAASPIRSA